MSTWQEDFDRACARVAESFRWPRMQERTAYLRSRDKGMSISRYAEAIYCTQRGKTYLSSDDQISWAYMGHHDDDSEPQNKPYYDAAKAAFTTRFPDYDKFECETGREWGGSSFDDEFYNVVC